MYPENEIEHIKRAHELYTDIEEEKDEQIDLNKKNKKPFNRFDYMDIEDENNG